jgi:iron(III) transport system ATP-binding protein
MPAPPRIRVSRLSKMFRRLGGGTVTPVDDVDLEVGAEEMVVLLGPSGCGKTTLLRCIAGLERPDAGEIEIDGQLVFSAKKDIFVPPERRALSMIFQSFALWPHMTVAANVAYPLESRGVPRESVQQRVTEALDLVGIAHLAAQFPAQISGGQQQRVALARALVGNTSVVLFDEPMSSVDAKVREQLRIELKRMQAKFRFSGLYVTHDQTEAMALGHRIAVLDSGKIAALGAPRAVYEFPPSEYVANFLGAANVIAGTVAGVSRDLLSVDTALGRFQAAIAGNAMFQTGERVKLIARPEKCRLLPAGVNDLPNAQPVHVETHMYAGAYTEYLVTRAGESMRVWVIDENEGDLLPDGAQATLSIAPDKLRVLRDMAS